MKTRVIFIVALLFTLAIFLWGDNQIMMQSTTDQALTHQRSSSREITTIYEEDFENGATDWVHYDETAPSDWNEAWHLSDVGAYSGNSWWMGDEDLGGYTSHRYLVLDTPVLTLSGAPELNFMLNLNCEDVGGTPPYDAWDGANVRISTDGGITWEVIAGSPAYNGTGFYSFGYEFNEGEGIPGWGGTELIHNWSAASFNLAAYAGQEVKIRFAFASDPAYDTADDPGMFGFKVDNIVIDTSTGTFESDGDGAAGDALMVPGYGGETAGDLWHVYEDAAAPSPTHGMGCFDDGTNTYVQGMSDFIISPEIQLPEEGELSWDIGCITMLDEGTFPDCDYIHVEVRSQIPGEPWLAWTSISNPLYDPAGNNYVFTGSITEWDTFVNGWGIQYGDISMLAGRMVQFRFGLHTNVTDEVVPGGFRLDDFYIQQEFFQGPGPQNLVAEAAGGEVNLSWDPIIEGGSEGWINWDDGLNDNSIGLTDGGTLWAAARFDELDMMPYVGGEITQMEVYIAEMPDEMILHVWSGNLGDTELMSQTYVPQADAWNTIDLATPVLIESMTEYWIGYEVTNDDTAHSAGTDIGPAVQGKGDFIATDPGAWNELYVYDLDYNWNIHAYVEAEGRNLPLFAGSREEREVNGYNIWRSDVSGEAYELVGNVPQDDNPTYVDDEAIAGEWNYYVVTAIYDGVDGEFSNEASVFVMNNDMLELGYDDGSAEAGLNVGIAQNMAVKFEPSYTHGSCVLTHVRFFIESLNTGQYVIRVFDDSGAGGMPGAAYLVQFVVTGGDLTAGWNTVAIPAANLEDVTFESGAYYVSIFEMANSSALGKDTDSVEGNSYMTANGNWQAVTDGNLMIRSYLYYPAGLGTYGDVDSNGVIDAYDASLVLMFAVSMPTPVDPFPEDLGDVDGNGYVEAYDAALILQYVVGIINEFPVENRISDIPFAELGYYFAGNDLVITAIGELYSASFEFPFKLETEKLEISNEFLTAVWKDKVAIASAIPVTGDILRIYVGEKREENLLIYTTANSVKGELMTGAPEAVSGIRSIYPNPFNPETTVSYTLGTDSQVTIDVYNCKGQKVETLLNARQSAGDQAVVWSAAGKASGIYFIRLNVNGKSEQQKVLMIK
ncbi:MAG: T9SS type A sorting domain-containing protein [Candidatus Cloacimonetes bacterium]|nr:T9SS type A sorting domain-containing protein [Candidatus Cloacimonadota bacterium]